ncbi:hypothetical protein F4818DRAFT_439124 [Hypoxylon cercidicola]|nr:hypothetical protein F4818DRAFT_439124 [Hypoxylon cercidicola]
MNPYESDPNKIPANDLYWDVPCYGRYLPRPDDFRVDRQYINSQSEDALKYWASVLDRCDENVRIYPQMTMVGTVDFTYADANEVQAIALAREVLGNVRVPEIYFKGKIDGRPVLIQERLPGPTPGQHQGHQHVAPDPNILTNGRINPLESEIFSRHKDDPDVGFMHNDFTTSNCIVDDDKIVGIIDWEMAGFFGWRTAAEIHVRIRTPQREHFVNANLSEETLQEIMFWTDLYDDT